MEYLYQAIDTFNVSDDEKAKCLKKAQITLNVLEAQGKITNGQKLIVRKTECAIMLGLEDGTIVFQNIFKKLFNPVVCSKTEMERLVETEKDFHKTKGPQDDLFYLHMDANAHMFASCDEFMCQLKEFEQNTGVKLWLYDCNIKTCKINGRKYKRITLTHEDHIFRQSKTEFCFGHMIPGWTYVFPPDKWSEIKEQVMSLVDYKTTTFGSSTRYDLSGNEYKAKH